MALRVNVSSDSTLTVGGQDGWCQWDVDGASDIRVRVLSSGGGAGLVVAAIAVGELGQSARRIRVTGNALRDIAVGVLERRINEPEPQTEIRHALANGKGPDLRPHRPRYTHQPSLDFGLETEAESKWEALRMEVPEGAKSDRFYAEVLKRFEDANRWSRRPAVEIALATGRPVTTVHRWVREAKRRAEAKRTRAKSSPP